MRKLSLKTLPAAIATAALLFGMQAHAQSQPAAPAIASTGDNTAGPQNSKAKTAEERAAAKSEKADKKAARKAARDTRVTTGAKPSGGATPADPAATPGNTGK